MHLIIIIAFASLLWFNTTRAMNLLHLSQGWSVLLVVGQILLLIAAAMFTARRTLRILAHHPADPNEAQHHHHLSSTVLQFVMLGFFVANLVLTCWPSVVTQGMKISRIYGLGDFLVLSPFLLTMLLVWIVQYPADRAIREMSLVPRLQQAHPVQPVWSLGQYLLFNVRYQMLTIAVPMMIIIIGDDAIDHYKRDLRSVAGGLIWMPDFLMGLLVCLVFLFAPVMLRFIWSTEPIPPGELRTNLERIARKMGLKYRDILIWRSQGMIVNAAVMGILPPVRYVLISDGLLEAMTDKQTEAVFGHEVGHVKHWHIPYFIVFAILTMFIAGGLMYLLNEQGPEWLTIQYIQIVVGFFIVGFWGFAFGWLSHRFEHQADISGAMSITPQASECDQSCLVHSSEETVAGPLLCAVASEQFGLALRRVAALNGIPLEEKGWRHPSIIKRILFLKRMSRDPVRAHQFMSLIKTVKVVLLVGTLIGLVTGTYLYWDYLLPKSVS